RQGVSRAVRALVGAGHSAQRAELYYPQTLGLSTMATWFAAAARDAEPFDTEELQPRTRRHVLLGRRSERFVRDADRQRWRERVVGWFEAGGHDLLVTPVLAGAPPRAEMWSRRGWQANLLGSMRYAPYPAPWNVAGLPAIAVPSGVRRDGLPAAVQIVGPPGSEERLLAVAAQLEQAAPWRTHAPGWPRLEKPAARAS
ncbi:MAG: amidase family protein, partial [Micromonosporaceae bacterium]